MVGLSVHTPDPTVVSTGTVFFKGGTKTEGERWREEEGAKRERVSYPSSTSQKPRPSIFGLRVRVLVYSCTRVLVYLLFSLSSFVLKGLLCWLDVPVFLASSWSNLWSNLYRFFLGVCLSFLFFLSCCLTSTWVRRPLKQPLNTSTTTNERAYLVRRPRERVICRHGEIIRRLADMTHRILVPSATGEQARVRLVHFVQEQAAAQHLAWRRCTRRERERERKAREERGEGKGREGEKDIYKRNLT